MPETPHKTPYDTNPLKRPAGTEEERDGGSVDTEGPTRPMSPQPLVSPDPYATVPASPETAARYMPPHTAPVAGPTAPPGAFAPRPPQSVAQQFGVTQNFAAMACYMPFLGIVASVLLTASEPRENRFVRFHAKQSLVAHIAFWAITLAFGVARASTPTVIGLLLLLPQLAFYLASIAGFVWMMAKAYRWQAAKIPIIGDQVE
jgi:uncharacterized membrane protein